MPSECRVTTEWRIAAYVDEALAQLVGLALQLVFALVRGAALVLAQQVGLVEIKVDGARRHLEDCGARAV